MATSSASFRYEPLDRSKDAFRLLRLFPGAEDDLLDCQLFNAKISPWMRRYVAGSYVWGSDANRKAIMVNNQRLDITANLYDFLHAARLLSKDKPLIIWIDAICIDQSSITERNHQVQNMASIYSSCSCVYSWFGRGDHTSDWLFKVMGRQRMREYMEQICNRNSSDGDFLKTAITRLRRSESDLMLTFLKTLVISLTMFGARAYWTGLWIVQEVYLAPDVLLLAGRHTLAWGATFPSTCLDFASATS